MNRYYLYLLLSLSLVLGAISLQAQNVGIGNPNPLEKLHISGGNLRVDALASPDTNVVVSDIDGKIINLDAGSTGQVLTSQGAGRAPIWANAGATVPSSDKIHFLRLTGAPSVTVNTSSASSLTLLTHNFIPANDTVIFSFSAQGRISSTVVLSSQLHTYVFRVIVNGVNYQQVYCHLVHNGAASVTSAFLPTNFSFPVPVNPGSNNTITVQVLTLFTASGSQTLTYDTSAFTQFATSMIYDFQTN